MAATINVDTNLEIGGGYNLVKGTFALDSSYPAGGEALDPSNIARIELLQANPGGTAAEGLGYLFRWDTANQKVVVAKSGLTGTVTVNPASHTTVASVNTDVTVTGLATTDIVAVVPPVTLEAGIVVQGAYVSAADTLRIRTTNPTAGTIDPASATWTWAVLNGAREVLAGTDLSAVTSVPFQGLVAY
jgi:hypothetical protein